MDQSQLVQGDQFNVNKNGGRRISRGRGMTKLVYSGPYSPLSNTKELFTSIDRPTPQIQTPSREGTKWPGKVMRRSWKGKLKRRVAELLYNRRPSHAPLASARGLSAHGRRLMFTWGAEVLPKIQWLFHQKLYPNETPRALFYKGQRISSTNDHSYSRNYCMYINQHQQKKNKTKNQKPYLIINSTNPRHQPQMWDRKSNQHNLFSRTRITHV